MPNTPQEITINVDDAYGEMRDPCRYTVYWSNSGNDSAAYYTKITNLTATAAGDLTFSVIYTAKGDYTSKYYVVNEDGKAQRLRFGECFFLGDSRNAFELIERQIATSVRQGQANDTSRQTKRSKI